MGTNQIITVGIVVIGIMAMVGLSALAGDPFMGIAIALMLTIGALLFQEIALRREGFNKVARGVIGLRETVDRSEGTVTRMKAEFDKTSNDARSARTRDADGWLLPHGSHVSPPPGHRFRHSRDTSWVPSGSGLAQRLVARRSHEMRPIGYVGSAQSCF